MSVAKNRKRYQKDTRDTRKNITKFLPLLLKHSHIQIRSKETVSQNQTKIVDQNFHRKVKPSIQQEKLMGHEIQRVKCSHNSSSSRKDRLTHSNVDWGLEQISGERKVLTVYPSSILPLTNESQMNAVGEKCRFLFDKQIE